MNSSYTSDYGKGIVAGFAATVVLSAVMLMKQVMGVMPQLDPIGMISSMLGVSRGIGWLVHFVIGTVAWGLAFAWAAPMLPGSSWLRGVLFSIGPWLMMMVALMPMAGAGLFGLGLGVMAPIATLLMHCIYGAVLGWAYGALLARGAPSDAVLRGGA